MHILWNNCCGDFNIGKINVPKWQSNADSKTNTKKYPTNNILLSQVMAEFMMLNIESNNEIILSDWWFEKEINL